MMFFMGTTGGPGGAAGRFRDLLNCSYRPLGTTAVGLARGKPAVANARNGSVRIQQIPCNVGTGSADKSEVMSGLNRSAGLQFEKQRAFARILLSNGERRDGCFFVAGVSAWHEGPERVGELLEKHDGFLPLESNVGADARTFLINPSHIIMVELDEDEARSDSGYAVARRQPVSLLLSLLLIQ